MTDDETREITPDPVDEPHEIRSHAALPSASPRFRALVIFLLAVIAIGLGALAYHQLTSRANSETARANKATTSAEQLCEQVRALGSVCAVDPSKLPKGPPGDTGPIGPPGPPPSDVQVREAVDAYCGVHGDCKGADGRTPTADQVAAAVRQFCDANGECQGPAGQSGTTGATGPAGPGPSDDQVAAAVAAFCAAHDQCAGPQGEPGPTGPPGADGQPPASFTWTDLLGRTHVCTRDVGSPDSAPTYTCS